MVLYNEYRFLIDCGEGTQRQLLKSGLGFKRLDKVLFTHGHLDHILGLGGLASTFSRWEAIDREIGVSHALLHQKIAEGQNQDWNNFIKSVEKRKKKHTDGSALPE